MSSFGVETMSIHKLTAGSGYDYLTRRVTAFDATAKGHVGLASYYAERGESPGVWAGSGMTGMDGLQVGDALTAEHMRACSARACIRWRRSDLPSNPILTRRPGSGRRSKSAALSPPIPGRGRQKIRCLDRS